MSNIKNCFICQTPETNKNFKKLVDDYYFCHDCYLSNKNSFDIMIPKKPLSKSEQSYRITNLAECVCGKLCSPVCLMKSCANCCVSKYCTRHKNKYKFTYGTTQCLVCGRNDSTQLVNFSSNGNLVQWCFSCCKAHKQIITHISNITLDEINQMSPVDDFPDSDSSTDSTWSTNSTDSDDFVQFAKDYKGKTISSDELEEKLKPHQDYCKHTLAGLDCKYKCPVCNRTNPIDESYECETCETLICDYCIKELVNKCPNQNCSYCRRGICFNVSYEHYCPNCFVDPNLEFYNRYKDKVLTWVDMTNMGEKVDLSEFEDSDLILDYECPMCSSIVPINDYLIKCSNCPKYVCNSDDCGHGVNSGCERWNCRYCADGTCYNAIYEYYCLDCSIKLGYRNNKPVKSKIDLTSEIAPDEISRCAICMENKKTYACVPCGHLCMCGPCASRIKKSCPICNITTSAIIKIFG